jgi:hypothetical protein
MVEQIRGRGSRGRRNEIAESLAALLRRHEMSGLAHLTIAQTIVEQLNADADADRAPGARRDFAFDQETGALCWSPNEVARVLSVDKQRLEVWRALGKGTKYIKYGSSGPSPVVYPITEVMDWLRQREAETGQREDAA